MHVLGAAQQVIDHPPPAIATAQAVHRREQLLGRQRRIRHGRRRQTEVALAAGLHLGLAEITAHGGGAAAGALQHGVELTGLLDLDLFHLLGDVALPDPAQRKGQVAGAVEGDAFGRRAVSAGPPHLLPIGFDRGRRVGVDDIADVGLVDAHAKGDGGDDHRPILLQESAEAGVAHRLVQARMIGERRRSRLGQQGRERLGAVARAGIDHAGAAWPLLHQVSDPGVGGPSLALGGELKFGAGETVDELPRILQTKLSSDIVAGSGVGGGGDRQPWNPLEHLGQPSERAVFRSKVVAPLADAVGLVDGDQRQPAIGQPFQHRRLHQTLRRHIEKVERPLPQPPPDPVALLRRNVGIQPLGRHAKLLQAGDLIGHQRDQRRHHQAQPLQHQAWDLIAQALAAARRQNGQGVASRQDLGDHRGLKPAEGFVAKGVAQHVQGGIGIGQGEHGAGMPSAAALRYPSPFAAR